MSLAELGLIGVFLAGAIPWMEAVLVVPSGIALGLDPVATVVCAVLGNVTTIFVFAYFGANLREQIRNWRLKRNKAPDSPGLSRAMKAFHKYGIYGMALLGPLVVGTQFAAAASVAAGVKPLRASLIISGGMMIWAVTVAVLMVMFDIRFGGV